MGQSLRNVSDELVKQELLVQYLQDAHSFSLQITKAIGIISKMMYEHTTTGVPASPPQRPGLEGPVLSVFD